MPKSSSPSRKADAAETNEAGDEHEGTPMNEAGGEGEMESADADDVARDEAAAPDADGGEGDADADAEADADADKPKRGRKPGKGTGKPRGRPPKAKKNILDIDIEGADGATEDMGGDSDDDHTVKLDAEGEKKINADGELLGGRQFKARAFRLARHPTRLYMLTLDVARALGFRDSYLLHLKNPQLRRLYATDDDKNKLESMELLASNFRSRPLGIMSARTVFKQFGYLIVVRGKPVRDDYVCTGKVEPENWVYKEDEDDRMSGGSDGEDRGLGDDKYRKGGSSVKRPIDSISYYEPIYRAPPALLHGFGLAGLPPAVPLSIPAPSSTAVAGDVKLDSNAMEIDSAPPPSSIVPNGEQHANGSASVAIATTAPAAVALSAVNPRSEANMLKSAASAAEFNSRLRAQRRRGRFLDVHTNVEQVPQLSQPTNVLVEKQLGGQEKGMVLEVSFGDIKSKPASSETDDWMAITCPVDASKYPIAVAPGQYQGAYSIHRTRYEQNVSAIKSNESFFVDYTGKPLLAAETQPQFAGQAPRGGAGPGGPNQNFAGQSQMRQPPSAAPMPGGRVAAAPAPIGTPTMSGAATSGGGSNTISAAEQANLGFIPAGMTQEQWQILKPKLTPSQLKEMREQAPVVSMGPSGKYSVRFTCGFLTRSGTYCQKPVMEAGLICLFHQKYRAEEMQKQQQQQQQQMAAPIAMPGMMSNMAIPGMNMGMSPGMMMPNMMGAMMAPQGFPMQNMMAVNPMTPSPIMYAAPQPTAQPTQRAVAPKQSALSKSSTSNNATPTGKKGKQSSLQTNLQDMECAMCHNEDPPEEEGDANPPSVLLRCAECGLGHHLTCADITTPVMVSKTLDKSAKWKCGNCKMCEVCQKAGEDETLMVLCDACDKGYHTYCLNPKMDKAPVGSWHCPACRLCISCNSTASIADCRHVSVPPSHEDIAVTGKIEIYACTYCAPCHKRFLAEQFCPLCFHVYNEEMEDIAMACCDVCDRWIHVGCDPDLTEARYKKLQNAKYTCVLCSEGSSKINALMQKVDKSNKASKSSKLMMYHGKYLVVPPLMKRAPEKI
ncbi:chromatin remodelling complex Rsc7/Swp82 subunit-domain-containing protein [Chytriomyces sp. MP71]|nr:chromatin remodelling complex Rsc7/Swp82 subunit-domain-containing protein [Chytriomyces sp. MP71]